MCSRRPVFLEIGASTSSCWRSGPTALLLDFGRLLSSSSGVLVLTRSVCWMFAGAGARSRGWSCVPRVDTKLDQAAFFQ
jgi:hypothetical protein